MNLSQNIQLEEVNLSFNQIEDVNFSALTALKRINVTSNKFKRIPKLMNPGLLEVLLISNNQITNLNELNELHQLTSLK